MKIRRFERRDELFNRSIPSFVNIIDNRINLKGKKRNNFESDPFENKGKEGKPLTTPKMEEKSMRGRLLRL